MPEPKVWGASDPLAWARQPKSITAWQLLVAGASEGHDGLLEILRDHVAHGRVPPTVRTAACEVFVA